MKIKITLLVIVTGLLYGFTKFESSGESKIEEGMIKVAIFYPNGEGNTFDMDYYTNNHMPMAADLFGDKLKAMVIDKGLGGGAPDSPAPYVAVGYFYFPDMATCQTQMGTHSEALRADVPNYTNIQPVLQISEVVSAD
ncbi:EthD family reductase [Maribacter algarum]|uniref:EthD family reductase n=1 Tax=Maribacter algarum (ex Zhang et al. 2020) TaxID=2578118 RepID=A0A5S3PRW5_9FLAO|nr:EthD family reductase [Maribacter algarum]TMM57401.1 EthD family reductase [Maribacter algarum]